MKLTEDNKGIFGLIIIIAIYVWYGSGLGSMVVLVSLVAVAVTIYYKAFDEFNDRRDTFAIAASLAIFFGHGYVHDHLIAKPIPGAFFEVRSYETELIAYAGLAGANEFVRVHAKIIRDSEYLEGDTDHMGRSSGISDRFYKVPWIKLPDGSIIWFMRDNIFYLNDLEEEISVFDEKHQEWRIKITTKPSH